MAINVHFNVSSLNKETAPAFSTEYLILLLVDGNATEYRIPAHNRGWWDEEKVISKAMEAAKIEHKQVEFYLSVNACVYENLSEEEEKHFIQVLWNLYADKMHALTQRIFNLAMIDHQTETESREYDKCVRQRNALIHDIYNYNK